MPSTIPYDPSLVLANVVSQDALDYVKAAEKAQDPANAAQDALNGLLSTKRSLEMTRTELLNMGITDTTALDTKLKSLNDRLPAVASDYAQKRIKAEEDLEHARDTLNKSRENSPGKPESPVDYVKTEIKSMPLASDSVNMDVQYFSFAESGQNAEEFANTISKFVSGSLSIFGTQVTSQATTAASNQVNAQTSKHDVAGTLVLAVSCTHKNASILAPFVLNVDKAIKTWNHLFTKDPLDPTDAKQLLDVASKPEEADRYSIVSGMTFGSSFVGMVHVLNSKTTSSNESMSALATSLQMQMDTGGWFENASGGFGVNESFANDVKNLLSTQNVTSHVTMICMGAIPSIVANDVKIGVQEFASFDPAKSMAALATLQNATTADQDTVKSAADAARTGKQMVSMRAGDVKSALSALGEIDDGANKILDINSMMTALDDYLKKASDGKCGIPINYYLKDITKKYLAEMWVAKYYPGRYIKIEGDDNNTNNNNTNNNTNNNPPPAE